MTILIMFLIGVGVAIHSIVKDTDVIWDLGTCAEVAIATLQLALLFGCIGLVMIIMPTFATNYVVEDSEVIVKPIYTLQDSDTYYEQEIVGGCLYYYIFTDTDGPTGTHKLEYINAEKTYIRTEQDQLSIEIHYKDITHPEFIKWMCYPLARTSRFIDYYVLNVP